MRSPGEIQGNYDNFFNSAQINKTEKNNGGSFQNTLAELVSNVNNQINESDRLTEDFAIGKNNNIHEVMIAAEKAGLSMKFLMQIRNKLLDAYQEIMRMNF
ncbi:MAG: flagellar hook-basal body complex protein FliE [Desulfobacteraceae bacterium]|jgi:flagellar hook-basal body complex protein FliE